MLAIQNIIIQSNELAYFSTFVLIRRDGSFNEPENCILSTLEVRFADGLSDYQPDRSWDLYLQTESSGCRGSGLAGSGSGGFVGRDPFSGGNIATSHFIARFFTLYHDAKRKIHPFRMAKKVRSINLLLMY